MRLIMRASDTFQPHILTRCYEADLVRISAYCVRIRYWRMAYFFHGWYSFSWSCHRSTALHMHWLSVCTVSVPGLKFADVSTGFTSGSLEKTSSFLGSKRGLVSYYPRVRPVSSEACVSGFCPRRIEETRLEDRVAPLYQ